MFSLIQNIDLYILSFIQNHFHNTILNKVMILFTKVGNLGIVWILLSIILFINKKYRNVGLLMISALLLGGILGEVFLKNIVKRARPFTYLKMANLLISKPLSYSFPSGHTTASFAAVGISMSKLKKYRFYILTVAILIAFSRLYLMVHYPTDVLFGIILGLLSSKIVLESKLEKKFKKSSL